MSQDSMSGSKKVEIRRRFSTNWKQQRAVFYATAPVGALVGEAEIHAVHEKTPSAIWKRFGHAIGCDKAYFDQYVEGCTKVFAIELQNARPFTVPMFAEALSPYVGDVLRPPQSYISLNADNSWSEAVNIAVMLQCLHKRVPLPLRAGNPHPRSVPLPSLPSQFSTRENPVTTQQELF